MSDQHAPMPTAEGLAEPLRSRWSPSVFDDEFELGDEQVVTLLRAGQWAPSWGNTQPWRFFVARRGDKTHAGAGRAPQPRQQRLGAASLGVLLTATQVAPDEDGEGGGPHAAYDLGQAAAHITIQAASMGLHAHQFAGLRPRRGRRTPRRARPLRGAQRDRGRPPRSRPTRSTNGSAARRTGSGDAGRSPSSCTPTRGDAVARRVSRASRRGMVLLVVLVVLINLPIVHSTFTDWRVDRPGVDVTAEVTEPA